MIQYTRLRLAANGLLERIEIWRENNLNIVIITDIFKDDVDFGVDNDAPDYPSKFKRIQH